MEIINTLNVGYEYCSDPDPDPYPCGELQIRIRIQGIYWVVKVQKHAMPKKIKLIL